MSMTNTTDPRKYMYFALQDWPRVENPKAIFPLVRLALGLDLVERVLVYSDLIDIFVRRETTFRRPRRLRPAPLASSAPSSLLVAPTLLV